MATSQLDLRTDLIDWRKRLETVIDEIRRKLSSRLVAFRTGFGAATNADRHSRNL